MFITTRIVGIILFINTVICQFVHHPFLGANYYTPDGQYRQDLIDPDGSVQGAYSYFDPTGKTISVRYTAGKHPQQVLHQTFPLESPNFTPTFYSQNNLIQEAPIPEKLFTPAVDNYPAESAKQAEAYNKALEEERQTQNNDLEDTSTFTPAMPEFGQGDFEKARSYVRFDTDKYNYEYYV